MVKRSALGRGLDALISTEEVKVEGSSSINEIDLSNIQPNPDQPRKEFDQSALEELAKSIRSLGIIQPITLQKIADNKYFIIAGERRYRASLLAGLTKIPAYVRTVSDQSVLEMALAENLQREDLNSIEIALAYQNLAETYHLTQEALSSRIGKSRATVTNYLRLLKLPAEIQMALKDRHIDMGHARALLSIESTRDQLNLFEETIKNNYSVRMVEELVKKLSQQSSDSEKSKIQNRSSEYKSLEKQLSSFFNCKISLSCNTNGKGKISIPFTSESDLERIMTMFDNIKK